MIKKIIYVLILFLVSSCIQEEETPDKLVRGYYGKNAHADHPRSV